MAKSIILLNNKKDINQVNDFLEKLKLNFQLFLHRKNLTKLAHLCQTDKVDDHFYTPNYETYFKKLRRKKIILLEIGIGGFENPLKGGESLRMWKSYFRKGKIHGIDVYDKSIQEEKRIKTHIGSQIDEAFLKSTIRQIGAPDIIIDDGSHINQHVIKSFEILFPLLKDGGIYVIEDTQTAYWEKFGGTSSTVSNSNTSLNYFKKLTDGLNYKEFLIENYTPSYYEKNIISIQFYHNMVFITKGKNEEVSNLVENGKLYIIPLKYRRQLNLNKIQNAIKNREKTLKEQSEKNIEIDYKTPKSISYDSGNIARLLKNRPKKSIKIDYPEE